MARLLRIAMLSLLLTGLSFQGAWAGAFQCSGEQHLQHVGQHGTSSMVVSDHGVEAPTGVEDCAIPAGSSCTVMGILPSLPDSLHGTGPEGVMTALSAPATAFLTGGPDRPPRASLA